MKNTAQRHEPDLSAGIEFAELDEGKPLLGHVGGEQLVLVRQGDRAFAVSAECTHYGGPLQEGVVADGEIRCPWHHAKFDLETGRAAGPAVEPLGCFEVEMSDGIVTVGDRLTRSSPTPHASPESVIIVGAGPAGAACAEKLRHLGYEGVIKMMANERFPVDRPNLSKDYLSGDAAEEWLPIRDAELYKSLNIDVVNETVVAIDANRREVRLSDDSVHKYGTLLLACGARPRNLDIEGAERALTLRSIKDADNIIERTESSKTVAVIGASFIGLEVAAALRQRGLQVTVIDQAEIPMAHVLGDEVGRVVQSIHEQHGVWFELGVEPVRLTAEGVVLKDRVIAADTIIAGIGVEPRLELAEAAGLVTDDGVIVDRQFHTSNADIYAAGDIARFPTNDGTARVEHFAVAVRQGQAAARNMLGFDDAPNIVPFFWSRHFDESIAYVGHAKDWDNVLIDGSLSDGDATVGYEADGRIRAVATLGRPAASLLAEVALEEGDQAGLRALVGASA